MSHIEHGVIYHHYFQRGKPEDRQGKSFLDTVSEGSFWFDSEPIEGAGNLRFRLGAFIHQNKPYLFALPEEIYQNPRNRKGNVFYLDRSMCLGILALPGPGNVHVDVNFHVPDLHIMQAEVYWKR